MAVIDKKKPIWEYCISGFCGWRGAPFCPLCWTPPRSRQNHPFLGISQKKTGELGAAVLGGTQSFPPPSSEYPEFAGFPSVLEVLPPYVRQQTRYWSWVCVSWLRWYVKTEDADGEWVGVKISLKPGSCSYSFVGRCIILPSRTHQCRSSISFLPLPPLSLFSRLFLSNFTHLKRGQNYNNTELNYASPRHWWCIQVFLCFIEFPSGW